MTADPGENPSLRFHSVGSIGLPSPPSVFSVPFRGMASGLKLTWTPVSVSAGFVKKLFGKGKRHMLLSSGSQYGSSRLGAASPSDGEGDGVGLGSSVGVGSGSGWASLG